MGEIMVRWLVSQFTVCVLSNGLRPARFGAVVAVFSSNYIAINHQDRPRTVLFLPLSSSLFVCTVIDYKSKKYK
jgi:hypothetical protein